MTKKILLYITISCFSFLLLGCLDATESDYDRQVREADEAIEAYLTSNNIDAEKQATGVYIEVITENGEGKEVVQDHVVGILYEMTHLEGEYLIESHTDTLNPLRFSYSYNAGYNSIHPAGLNYEIGKMKQGEKFRFYIPSYQAFDNYSHDDLFDSYSHFIVEVDLIDVKTEEEIYDLELEEIKKYIDANEPEAESYPNGLYYTVTEESDGNTPNNSSQVEFHFTRRYLDGTIIQTTVDDEPVTAYFNNNQLVPGLETGLLLMNEGEKAKFIMPSKLGFGKSIQVIPQKLRDDWVEDGEINPATRPYSPLIYEIELLDVK